MRMAVALAIFFGSGEFLARRLDLVDRLNPTPRRLYEATDDPDLPYRLRPGVTTRLFVTVPVRINRAGLRDREIGATPPPGTTRILALGDSVTFGWVCPVEASYPRLLERLLRRAGHRVEVLNGGVAGYDTVAEAAFLETVGLRLAPAVVLVQVNLNDFQPPPVINGLGVLSGGGERIAAWSPANWSEFYLLLRWIGVMVRVRVWLPGLPPVRAPDYRAAAERLSNLDREMAARRAAFYRAPDPARWQRLERGFATLAALGRAHAIRVIAWIQPDGTQLAGADPDREPQRRLLGLCRAQGLECLDLLDDLRAAGGLRLYNDASHPNAAGTKLIAHRLARALGPELS